MKSNRNRSAETVLTRRVKKILPEKTGLKKLMQSREIHLYQGFDPTGSKLHLGHSIGLRKLMEFAELGHRVTFLFGTGTILVGDPSQRQAARKPIDQKQIDSNIKSWKKQVEPIVDFNKVKIRQNGDWLLKLRLKDLINIASNISAVQLFKRDMFQKRIESGDTVWFHETMYPLLQGYDSVVLDVDLEVGGTDQEFNMLIGRELMRKMKGKQKYVLTVPMILGTDGRPMSKTSNNCIWLDDSADEMYGKLMSIDDKQIPSYLELLTDIPPEKISNQNPLKLKKMLALDITSQYRGRGQALAAQKKFERVVQKGQIPKKLPTIFINSGSHTLLDIFKKAKPKTSRSQIKRTIKQGGVEWNGKKITDPNKHLQVEGGEVIKFGKRWFRKIKVLKIEP